MDEPPEEGGDSKEQKKDDALEKNRMRLQKGSDGQLTPCDSEEDATSERVRPTRHEKNSEVAALAGIPQENQAKDWCQANSCSEEAKQSPER